MPVTGADRSEHCQREAIVAAARHAFYSNLRSRHIPGKVEESPEAKDQDSAARVRLVWLHSAIYRAFQAT
jgi:hypothetical protein